MDLPRELRVALAEPYLEPPKFVNIETRKGLNFGIPHSEIQAGGTVRSEPLPTIYLQTTIPMSSDSPKPTPAEDSQVPVDEQANPTNSASSNPAEVSASDSNETSEAEQKRRILIGTQRGAAHMPKPREPEPTSAESQQAEPAPAEQAPAPETQEPAASEAAAPENAAEASTPAATEPSQPAEAPTPQIPPQPITPVTAKDDAEVESQVAAALAQNAPPAPVADDLDAEVASAMEGISLDDVLTGGVTGGKEQRIENDTRLRGTVVKVHKDDVFFALDGQKEGIASVRQFKEPPSMGESMELIVKGYNEAEALYQVAPPGAAVEVFDWSELEEGTVVEARVTGANTGGLEAMVNNIRAFIPASQIAVFRVDNFNDYIGKKLPCLVTEANEKRRNLVLSHRSILEKQAEEERKEKLETLEAGAIVEGTVRKLQDFGAFVDLGGVDGLIHVSKLAWDRVSHPKEVVSEGQKVKVKIEKINPQNGKISLSLRDLTEDPWSNVEDKFPVGTTLTAKVSRVAKFGAFVKLDTGVEGLIHISELAHHRVFAVKNIVKEGDEVTVKVVSVEKDKQRIGLSLKATQEAPQKKHADKPEEEIDETPRELSVKRKAGELKGGTDRPSGGESFGLKW